MATILPNEQCFSDAPVIFFLEEVVTSNLVHDQNIGREPKFYHIELSGGGFPLELVAS